MDAVKLKSTTLRACAPSKAFRAVRGDVIRKITDLANCIDSLSEKEFKHHVGKKFDHFGDWIRHTLKNPNLANDLKFEVNKKDKKHYVMTIRHHVKWLKSVVTPKRKPAKKKPTKKKK